MAKYADIEKKYEGGEDIWYMRWTMDALCICCIWTLYILWTMWYIYFIRGLSCELRLAQKQHYSGEVFR